MNKIKKKQIVYLDFMILMIALGASDALRGVFAPIFQTHFALTASRLSAIITVSYLGNLVFLLVGTRFADRYSMKRVFAGVTVMWLCALGLYITTDNFYVLLIGMFFSMGASTLLNTMVNLLSPLLFAAPGMVINTLFFTQGIGTSASQGVIGNMADGYGWGKGVNGVLFLMGTVSLILFLMLDIPEREKEGVKDKNDKNSLKQQLTQPVFWYFFLIFGFYFIAEHGIMNWLVIYCQQQLGMETGRASLYLAMFFGGMTVGRLVMSPFVQKLGALKSICVFGGIGTVLYIGALVPNSEKTMILMGIAGLFLSIVYPTLVYAIQGFYPSGSVASATGTIISAATVFDIGFNAIFGKIIDAAGFRTGFMILPVSLALFIVIFIVFTMGVKPLKQV